MGPSSIDLGRGSSLQGYSQPFYIEMVTRTLGIDAGSISALNIPVIIREQGHNYQS